MLNPIFFTVNLSKKMGLYRENVLIFNKMNKKVQNLLNFAKILLYCLNAEIPTGEKMYRFKLDLSQLKRESGFPYRLWQVFQCRGLSLRTDQNTARKNYFEVCLRLESEAKICQDIINGHPIHVPYPHAVWKMPMQQIAPGDNYPRDVLALIYPSETVDLFRQAGLVPDVSCLPFVMNTEISFLTEKFIRLVNNLYSPGVADQLDWIGFCLIKEVLLTASNRPEVQTMEQKMKNIALWLKNHCSESPDFHALARQYDLNYSLFYQEWRRHIGITPYQYVIQSRLAAAADLLKNSEIPICKIVGMVNFSGTYVFYRRFEQQYGMTPSQYRKQSKN